MVQGCKPSRKIGSEDRIAQRLMNQLAWTTQFKRNKRNPTSARWRWELTLLAPISVLWKLYTCTHIKKVGGREDRNGREEKGGGKEKRKERQP